LLSGDRPGSQELEDVMSEGDYNPAYLLDSDEEPLRLERQARVYGFEDDLRHLALRVTDGVLDAGCGSGSITRAIASEVPQGSVTGLDREPKHVDFARRKAAAEGIGNIRFEVGDVLALPFEDGSFEVAWSKHLLQWVKDRERALGELKRVVRPGGRVVVCNFDYFCVCHYPEDAELQADAEVFFDAVRQELEFDTLLGRKLPHLFIQAGFQDVKVDFIPDRTFGGFGGDPEKRWNWETQFQQRVIGFSTKVFGSVDRAQRFGSRLVDRFSRPDVYVFCPPVLCRGACSLTTRSSLCRSPG
jgi:SAM-dependent methyltransferase